EHSEQDDSLFTGCFARVLYCQEELRKGEIMFGEMWISAAGASNSRRRLRGRLATPRQTWRGHDSTNSPLEALPRLSSLGGHANSALLPTGHGHPLSLG